MKKFSFLAFALVGFLLMTGCKKDPVAPKLTLMTGEGYLCEGAETMVGEPFKVSLQCEADKLAALNVIFMKGEAFATEDTQTWDNASNATYDRSFIIMYDGDITMTATLFDTNGKTATITVNFKSLPAADPDPDPTPDPDPDPDPDPEPVSFDGLYDGYLKTDGTVSTLGISYPVNDSSQVAMSINVLEDNEVKGVYTYQGMDYDLTGSIQGDTIVFDPFTLEIANADIQLNATIGLSGLLEEDILSLEGNVSDCLLNYGGMQIPVTFVGEIRSVLKKAED